MILTAATLIRGIILPLLAFFVTGGNGDLENSSSCSKTCFVVPLKLEDALGKSLRGMNFSLGGKNAPLKEEAEFLSINLGRCVSLFPENVNCFPVETERRIIDVYTDGEEDEALLSHLTWNEAEQKAKDSTDDEQDHKPRFLRRHKSAKKKKERNLSGNPTFFSSAPKIRTSKKIPDEKVLLLGGKEKEEKSLPGMIKEEGLGESGRQFDYRRKRSSKKKTLIGEEKEKKDFNPQKQQEQKPLKNSFNENEKSLRRKHIRIAVPDHKSCSCDDNFKPDPKRERRSVLDESSTTSKIPSSSIKKSEEEKAGNRFDEEEELTKENLLLGAKDPQNNEGLQSLMLSTADSNLRGAAGGEINPDITSVESRVYYETCLACKRQSELCEEDGQIYDHDVCHCVYPASKTFLNSFYTLGVVMLTVMVCCFLVFGVQKGDEYVLNSRRSIRRRSSGYMANGNGSVSHHSHHDSHHNHRSHSMSNANGSPSSKCNGSSGGGGGHHQSHHHRSSVTKSYTNSRQHSVISGDKNFGGHHSSTSNHSHRLGHAVRHASVDVPSSTVTAASSSNPDQPPRRSTIHSTSSPMKKPPPKAQYSLVSSDEVEISSNQKLNKILPAASSSVKRPLAGLSLLRSTPALAEDEEESENEKT